MPQTYSLSANLNDIHLLNININVNITITIDQYSTSTIKPYVLVGGILALHNRPILLLRYFLKTMYKTNQR